MPKSLKASASPKPLQINAETSVPSFLGMQAHLELEAAEKDSEGKTKLPKFKIVANTGAPMNVPDYPYPVIVDLKGAKFAQAKTPIIMDHDRKARIGHTTEQTINDKLIAVRGLVSSSSQSAKEFVNDSQNDFPFQASVGGDIKKAQWVPSGEAVEVNGQTHKGPAIVARKLSIREVSVTLMGGDGNTSAKIAATKGEPVMNEFEKWLAAQKLDSATLTAEQKTALQTQFDELTELRASSNTVVEVDGEEEPEPVPTRKLKATRGKSQVEKTREQIAIEEERIDGIRTLFANSRYNALKEVEYEGKKIKLGSLKAKAVRDGWSEDKTERTLLLASFEEPTSGPGIHVKMPIEGEELTQALSCSVCKQVMMMPAKGERAGVGFGYEQQFGEKVLEASDRKEFRAMGLHYLMDMTIKAATGSTFDGSRKSTEFERAYVTACRELKASGPFSTLTVGHILEDAGQKYLLTRFSMSDTAWQEICQMRSLVDFKPQKLYRMSESLGYLPVGPDGSLKSGELADTKRTLEIGTVGRTISLNRTHRINDDLGAFTQLLQGLADGCVWAIESLVFSTLLDAASVFDDDNTITDPLSLDALETAEVTFDSLVGLGGKPINSTPAILLTGTKLHPLARRIFNNENLLSIADNGSRIFTSNDYVNKYRPVKAKYLDNTLIKKPDGKAISSHQSNTLWYMLSNPQLLAVLVIGFLNGRQTPIIESSEADFDTLGMKWRGYHDVGVSEGDKEAGVRSTGLGS